MVNETDLDDLLNGIRSYRRAKGLSVRGLAAMAGVSDATLRAIDSPDWSPTVSTVRALLRAIAGAPGKLLEAGPQLDRLTREMQPFRGPEGRVLERVLKPEALSVLGQSGLVAACQHLSDGWEDPERAVELAKRLAEGSAVHLIDVGAEDPARYRFRHWDSSTGYRAGADFTGSELGDVEDCAYREALVRAYRATRESGRPRVSFVHRRGPDGVRTFYRVLVPLIGDGRTPQIVSVTLPEAPQAARHLFPHGMRV